MNSNHLISIIVPVYNAERSVERCVQSILGQSYKHIELLVVNDGSTDSSSSICHHIENLDSRIKVFDIKNSGSAAARNYALNRISGDYVSFVDSDDYVDPGMLQGLYSYMDGNSIVRSFGIDELPDGTPVQFNSSPSISLSVPCDELSFTGPELYGPVVWGALFPRDVIDSVRFSTEYSVGEDSLFLSRVCRNASFIKVVPDRWYHYVLNPRSITHSVYSEKRYSEILAWETIVSESRDNSIIESSARSALCIRALAGLVEVATSKATYQIDYKSNLRAVAKDNFPFLLRDPNCSLRRKAAKLLALLCPTAYSRLLIR